MDNCILYDWFNFTLPEDGDWYYEYGESLKDGQVIIDLLGMSGCDFTVLSGVRGYSKKLWFDGVNIHLPSEQQNNVWLEMSGSGCRAFETYGHGNWDKLISFALCYGHITRTDVSFDDHTGLLDMLTLVNDTMNREFVTKAYKHGIEIGLDDRLSGYDGMTVYHGKRPSNTLIRIYDKAQQLRRYDEHWVRVEMELHDENARAFLELPGTIGEKWSGVLLNYVRYVDVSETDSNRWRWPLKSYWSDLVGAASPIKLYSAPGAEYNMESVDRYVFGQAGNSIRTYIDIFGIDTFLQRLKETRPLFVPDKYKLLKQIYGRGEGHEKK